MNLISAIREEWLEFTPVKADIMRRLYQESTIIHITGFFLAILLAVALVRTGLALSEVYLWSAIMVTTYLGRFTLTYCYLRKKTLNIHWLNKFRISSIITGLAWGSSAMLLFQPGDLSNQAIILFTLTGLCAGATLSYATDYSVLLGFLLPILLSIFARLMLEGSNASMIMGLMVLLFLIFTIIHARRTIKIFIKNAHLAKTALAGEVREKAHRQIMEMIANNKSLEKTLDKIVFSLEKQNPAMQCSILLLEPDNKHLKVVSAPSLPDFYNKAIDGIGIGVDIGCCGASAFIGERVIAEDTQAHPNWVNYQELITEANLRACWSEPIKDSTGKVLGTFAIYHNKPTTPSEKDIQIIIQNAALAAIAIELARSSQEQRLAALFYQNTNESMIITDSNNIIVGVNPAFTIDSGYSAESVLGKSTNILKSSQNDKSFYDNISHDLDVTGEWQGEISNKRKDGSVHTAWVRASTINDDHGKVLNRVILATDITKKKEAEDLIWKQANYDELTSLPNRRMFLDRFQQEIKKTDRAQLPLALLFIDLDEFKEVNDALGHHMGDVLLQETAERITSCVRESDTVAQLNSVARLGGDEFTVVLSALEDIDSVEHIAQRILEKITEPYQLNEEVVYISASIGITLYPNDATDVATLLKNADQAMYAAKKIGKNCFSYFTESMQVKAQNRLRLTKDLYKAQQSQQFHLVYQPIVNLLTNEIQKAEALIRWQHPTKGLISPAEFIPIAENTGIIHDIGNWVFKEALAQVVKWRESIHPNFQISINKSPVQFHHTSNSKDRNYLNWPNYLREQGLPGECIAVEITEGSLLDSNEAVHAHLLEFRDAGIQVALDDFGTGYSSLSYLRKFDIDYIKIDQSFVQNLEQDSDDMALCQAIIVMAHKLKLKVIAEGIETQKQLDLLKSAGCDYGQGYFLSKPLISSDFESFTT